ncbi:MAG: outer membrane beta-barrel protein [Bacteroidota bacterium]
MGCVPLTVYGQTNFLPGYYITRQSDTIRCLIEYRSPERMAEGIRFKKTLNSRVLELEPGSVRSVVIQDQNFFESLVYRAKPEEALIGFFKMIVKGRLTLYRYGNRYFVSKTGDDLREVTKTKRKLETYLIANNYSGLGVLRSLIDDCSSMSEQLLLDNFNGTDTGYRNIVNKYNSCFPEGTNDIADIKIRSRLELGVTGSLNGTQLSFAKTSLPQAHFNWSSSIGGGIFLSIFSPQMGDKLRFVVEPYFGKNHQYSYFQANQTTADLFINYSFVRAPLLFRYFCNDYLFLDIGVTNVIVLNSQTTWRAETPDPSGNFVETSNGPAYKVKSNLAGLAGGVGVKMKMGKMALLTSVRASNIFRLQGDVSNNQPITKWADLNIALQLK